jgi:hypothetical protein
MSVYTALLDANVLYPAPVRDIFIQLAVTDIYHAKWSATIHDEWMRSLLRDSDKPRLDRAVLERTRRTQGDWLRWWSSETKRSSLC